MARVGKNKGGRVVAAIKHQEGRKNIPSVEYEGVVSRMGDDVACAYKRRNAELDPQLWWRGKDAENEVDLLLSAPPVYVQEKIHPQAVMERLRRETRVRRSEEVGAVRNLFKQDFDGLPSEDAKLQFYQHEQKWANRMIFGDSLMVMASLAHREALKGQVQCIYMDPPYGIKFASNWQTSTKSTAVGESESLEPEAIQAFRDTWHDGVHSYLSYLRDRLVVARELLAESGSVFVQISEDNMHAVRSVMDEVFGAGNFVNNVAYKTTGGTPQKKALRRVNDYLVWYAKNKAEMKFNRLYARQEMDLGIFRRTEEADGTRRTMTAEELAVADKGEGGLRPFRTLPLHSMSGKDRTPRSFEGESWNIPAGGWRYSLANFKRLIKANRIVREKTVLGSVYYFHDFPYAELTSVWTDTAPELNKRYVVQTSEKVIARCVLMTTDPGDLVLDPTCGGGTTAFVAEKWGRRWITIDTSRVALAIARTRLMGGVFEYFLMRDSAEGAREEAKLGGGEVVERAWTGNVRGGFVYERVPHVTLGDIANNAAIDEVWEARREEEARLRAALNAAVGAEWLEWEVPRRAAAEWGEAAVRAHEAWAALCAARRREVEACVARGAVAELLVDRPVVARDTVRVTGPFTMESLSPHRAIPTAAGTDAALLAEAAAGAEEEGGVAPRPVSTHLRPASFVEEGADFLEVIRENLKTSGVLQGHAGERLVFDDVRGWAGRCVQLVGLYGEGRRAAICVGPEYGTVSRTLFRAAAREAADMFDMLVIMGFAFEAYADSQAVNVGVPVVRVRLNHDLHMADRLRRGSSSSNLFMVFGEPDIRLHRVGGPGGPGEWVVEIVGVDIFDPGTGRVFRSGPEDIACWMMDTDYDGESFFARHVYFTGGGKDPYKSLRAALRAEIDEEGWAGLYRARSVPFARPKEGRVAVKAINHLGDEVIKVFEVGV